MAVGFKHAGYGVLLTLFLTAVTTACRIRTRFGGQATWERLQVERALQADQCVYFDAQKRAAVEKAWADNAKNADYPIPDLAIEIDISTPQVDRADIYAKLGIFEIWRFDGDVAVIEQLGPDGRYVAVERSAFVPVRAEHSRRWLVVEDSSDDLEWKDRLAEWANGLARKSR
jgi:Uma2 family endonuclease